MRRGLAIGAVVLAGSTARADDPATLEVEITSAYGALRAGDGQAIDRLRDLRVRAEAMTGQAAVPGIDADTVASVPGSRFHVVGARDIAVIVDRTNRPRAWFHLPTPKGPCPPCGPRARRIVTWSASPHLVEIGGLEMGARMVLDMTSLATIVAPGALTGASAPSPDGSRLAFLALEYDEDGACLAQLTTVETNGTQVVSSRAPVPKDMCQGDYLLAWRGRRLVATSEWSEDYITLDPRADVVTTIHRRAPTLGPRPHRSRDLTDAQRRAFARTACTVDDRYVFPTAACTEPPSQ